MLVYAQILVQVFAWWLGDKYLIARYSIDNTRTVTRIPSRESGFVRGDDPALLNKTSP